MNIIAAYSKIDFYMGSIACSDEHEPPRFKVYVQSVQVYKFYCNYFVRYKTCKRKKIAFSKDAML